MADLIDRAKLFTERMPIHEGDPLARLNEVLKRLRNAPAVDAVEVVRCCDCEHHERCHIESLLVDWGIENPYCCIGELEGRKCGKNCMS